MDPDLSKRQRLFIALYPNTAARDALYQLARDLVKESGGRVVPATNLHVTLKFLGPVDQSTQACLQQKLDRVRAQRFMLRFGGIEYRKRQQMLWAVLADLPDALLELGEMVERSAIDCGLPPNNHTFSPHMTLARKVHKKMRLPDIEVPETQIEEFNLVRSETLPEGSQYTKLKSWRLNTDNIK
ncbi:MAG: RNA 2',3'-cyclic phosphodiesterase [Acidiferrobacterales bacterium]